MRAIKAIIVRNLITLMRDKMKLFFTLFMSGLFLFIFSFVTKSMAVGLHNPMNYLISGIIIMTVFQSSLNNSMGILEDISSGFMKEIIVAPIARWQIAIGQILSSAIVAVVQSMIIVVLGLFMGLQADAIHLVIMVFVMFLVGVTFSAMGLYLATIAKDSSNFQLLISIVTFPLTFLSGAYIPTMALPNILLPIVYLNPLTYTTALFRYVALQMENDPPLNLLKAGITFSISGFTITPYIELGIIVGMCLLLFTLCVIQFSKADFSKVKVFKHHRK